MPYDYIVHLVDPDESIGEALSVLLGTYGITVCNYSNAESFLLASQADSTKQSSCLLIADNLPGMSGLSSVRALREQGFSLPVIVITDTISTGFRAQALRQGATDVLEKQLMHGFLPEKLGTLLPGLKSLNESVSSGTLFANGTRVTFRINRPEDAEMENTFTQFLFEQSHDARYSPNIEQLSDKMLEQFSHPNYPESRVLLAIIDHGDKEQQIGVARYLPTDIQGNAEFAVIVADEWQRQGIGSKLLCGLTNAAAIAGIRQLQGKVLQDNTAMLRLAKTQGFSSTRCSCNANMLSIAKSLNFVSDSKA